jgi:hypothetical protein
MYLAIVMGSSTQSNREGVENEHCNISEARELVAFF